MCDLYLALDLDPDEAALDAFPDEAAFGATNAGHILAHPLVQGDGWKRHWRAFPGGDEGREAAKEYARKNPTIIVIPLDMATVPIEDLA